MKKIIFALAFLFLFFISVVGQNVGIGTNTPKARLHVSDSNVVFTGGSATLPASPKDPPVINGGVRLMWYPDKGAFRAGGVFNSNWNKTNIGNYSIGLGFNTQSRGDYSFAAGQATVATGISSFAANYSTTARGNYSTALGEKTTANSYASLTLGRYNIVEGDVDAWVDDDPIFVIGNGTQEVVNNILTITPSNAFTILKNGHTTIEGHTVLKGGLTASGSISMYAPSTYNPIMNGTTSMQGKIYYRMSVVTIPVNAPPVYPLYTRLATFFEVRLIRQQGDLIYSDISLSDGEHIGEVITLYSRDRLSSDLPTLGPGLQYGVAMLRDNLQNNVNIASDFSASGDSAITLMWNGSFWVEISRSRN